MLSAHFLWTITHNHFPVLFYLPSFFLTCLWSFFLLFIHSLSSSTSLSLPLTYFSISLEPHSLSLPSPPPLPLPLPLPSSLYQSSFLSFLVLLITRHKRKKIFPQHIESNQNRLIYQLTFPISSEPRIASKSVRDVAISSMLRVTTAASVAWVSFWPVIKKKHKFKYNKIVKSICDPVKRLGI